MSARPDAASSELQPLTLAEVDRILAIKDDSLRNLHVTQGYHRLSHGLARHGTQRYSQAQEANIIASILLGSNPGAIAQIGAQIAAAGAFARFSRDDEREADQMAVELMAATGYNPEGLARLLERLMQQGTGGGFFSSHPNPEERVQNVRGFARGVNTSGLRMDESGFATVRSRAAQYR